MERNSKLVLIITLAMSVLLFSVPAKAQIGGATSTGGDFLLEDVEDLDLFADSLERDWITDTFGFAPVVNVLSAVDPSSYSLGLSSGQSPSGVFRAEVVGTFGYAEKTFGVPMPAVKGASTAGFPGDITSFGGISFFATYISELSTHDFLVILECYPQQSDGKYPKLFYAYEPPLGGDFEPIRLDLRAPDAIINTTGKTVEELLSATRFLAFYYYAEITPVKDRFYAFVDDITLTADRPALATGWAFYE